MTNLEIITLLRHVALAYRILGENRFKIIAYERAADSIETLTKDVKDYWQENKLTDIPGVGEGLAHNIDDVFRTGHSSYWDTILNQIPAAVFPLLDIPGLGPKKAFLLAQKLSLTNEKTAVQMVEKAAKSNVIASIEGFGEQSQRALLDAIQAYKKGAIKEQRTLLSAADAIAHEVILFLKKCPDVLRTDVLGSLRRQVATIGDIDIAVATKKPASVIAWFLTFPHQKIIDQGISGASVLLHNGKQVDLRVQSPESFGAMLQYFTGSKNHNIALREHALRRGLSLSEHGIKHVKSGVMTTYATEEALYRAVGFGYIPPELREGRGELDAAIPTLVETKDIRGDVHVHSDYDLHSSHDVGRDTVGTMLTKAAQLGYDYIGFSDHNPRISGESSATIIEIMKRRKYEYEHKYTSWKQKILKTSLPADRQVQYFLMCEVDIGPDGTLALPEKALDYVDAVIISIHSAFTQSREQSTSRLIRAMESHPKVRIIGHPTGRLLGRRDGIQADWPQIFAIAKKHAIALEINAYPDRLDLPDVLVYDAVRAGVRFCIDTDAHAVDHMDLIPYGVSVARRGWCTKRDIVNTLDYNNFRKWLLKK